VPFRQIYARAEGLAVITPMVIAVRLVVAPHPDDSRPTRERSGQ
jgi:hypothetical protein